jgi:hypothetical protein
MNKPNQNELHSGHVSGLLIIGILFAKALIDVKIEENDHMYETAIDIRR